MSYGVAFDLVQRALPAIAPRRNAAHLKLRLQVTGSAVAHARQLARLCRSPSPALAAMMAERPAVLAGPLVWPYLCAAWSARERLSRLADHYRIIDQLGAPFPFSVEERLVLAELEDVHPGLRVVLDQPRWFMREGGLTLNLFVDDFRAYSLAFSFSTSPGGGIDCLIGSLQGRNSDEALALYRDLTKAAHGLRPRDFLIEICRMLCRHWKVERLLGVRDEHRHHRHRFFGGKTIAPQDYDAIWEDRGGRIEGAHFYQLPLGAERRSEDEIKPNKRSLYRRRYRFLDELEAGVINGLPAMQPQRFEDR